MTAFKDNRPDIIRIRFREIEPVTIRHLHATLAAAENIRYAREDGTVMRVRALSIGLTEPARKVTHVAVHGTTEDGQDAEDTFTDSARAVPPELFHYLYPPEVAQLMTAAINADASRQTPPPTAISSRANGPARHAKRNPDSSH